MREEVSRSNSIDAIITGHPMYINIAIRHGRSKQTTYVKETLQHVVGDILAAHDVNLEVEPVKVGPNIFYGTGTFALLNEISADTQTAYQYPRNAYRTGISCIPGLKLRESSPSP